jgi:pimeloyl-ACP methyl ester carboxylesterase
MSVLFSIVGFLGIPVGAYLVSLCARGGVSAWGWAWMVVYILIDFAAFSAQGEPRRAKMLLAAGLVILAGIVGIRNTRVHPTAEGTIVRLPSGSPGPWADRLAEDGDLGMMMFIAMSDFGGVRADDRRRAKPYMRAAYARMRRDTAYAPIPSPIVSNLLGDTSPSNLHTLILNPQEQAPRAIIFLHGVGGSSKLPCYLMASRMPDAMILCPTIGMGGEWADDRGVEAWRTLLAYTRLHASSVYVIGHGYGGRGLLHLLGRNLLGHVSGAVLIAGFDENYFDSVRRSTIPLLIIRGDQDARTPPFQVEGVANLHLVQNIELPAGHYVFYEQEDEVLERLDAFCGAR